MKNQREIEFRAWDKINKRMVNVNDFSGLEKDDLSEFKYITCSQHVIDWKDIILMQFTGLLDKNGKKIFEGDVVRRIKEKPNKFHFEIYDPNPLISEIFYDRAGFFVKGIADMDFYLGAVHEKIEVIGNIYENPELLTTNEQKNDISIN